MLKAEDVFQPGAFPGHTYVSRVSPLSGLTYESRLNQAIRMPGILAALIGPPKTGKTVLCEKVIGLGHMVEIPGACLNGGTGFWELAAARAGFPHEGQFTPEGTAKGLGGGCPKKETYALIKDKIIRYYKEKGLVLVIDGFHDVPRQERAKIAQQLKDAAHKGLKAAIISLPHRAGEAVRQNADLSGRLSLVNIEPWTVKDLAGIAKNGFNQLGIPIDGPIANQIAAESLSSPQLTQYICLNICAILEMEKGNRKTVSPQVIKTACRYTTANFGYGEVISLMQKGPGAKGKPKDRFRTKEGRELDIYGLVLEAVAGSPPTMQLKPEDIEERVFGLVAEGYKKPKLQTIKDGLAKLQVLINGKEGTSRVLEWEGDTLHILDPLFLFYLRWGVYPKGQARDVGQQPSCRIL